MGQLGLPASMTAFSFVGVFVTGATNVAFGEMLWDRLLSSVKSTIRLRIIRCIRNCSRHHDNEYCCKRSRSCKWYLELEPSNFYRHGVIITGIAGIVIMPWKLLSSAEAYLFDWLGTYSIFLGPLAGLYIADYYIYRRKVIDLDDLFRGEQSRYWYGGGFNSKAIYTWIISGILPLLGKIIPSLSWFADNGWMVGFIIALIVYPLLMKNETASLLAPEEEEQITERALAD